ncbi:MAG: DNA internalization-related competence protein ComEC/Rec2, partial [Halothiobacillus sp.]|nr:DNA internalization-related competence protein ComEC/Rec2 [Halothiobacillus sp.]
MLPSLPGSIGLWLAAAGAAASCAVWVRVGNFQWRVLAALALGLSAGVLNAALQAQQRLDDGLADAHQDQVSRLVLRVAALPDGDAKR